MSKRLEILKTSLANKEAAFNKRFAEHTADVKSANGQPLNDKRNGAATLNRWSKQEQGLRNIQTSITKTKEAIEVEEGKIANVAATRAILPASIQKLIDANELTQWRKHPHIFFVQGVEKARIIWDAKSKALSHKYSKQITDKEQWAKFAKLFNSLSAELNTIYKK